MHKNFFIHIYMNFINGMIFYLFLTFIYCTLDKQIQKKYEGTYYIIHGVSNMFITYSCLNDVVKTYTELNNFNKYPIDYTPSIITLSLHSYHIINYFKKLQFDDWLHHILMCGIALPMGLSMNAGFLLNHSLFFLTGLPGGINYFLLFFTRNKCMKRLTQKKVNNALNLWVRAPGCISHSAVTLVTYYNYPESFSDMQFYLIMCTVILTFWNGIYFMNQVVTNYAIQNYRENLVLKDKV